MTDGFFQKLTRETPTAFWNDSAVEGDIIRAIANGATGATTNPVLVRKLVETDQARWKKKLGRIIAARPDLQDGELAWELVCGMAEEDSRLLGAEFARSGGASGFLSVQVDPTAYRDSDAMISQAVGLSRRAPNLAIKIPATRAGLDAVEELTARGITTTATVSFTVAQARAIAAAFERGLRRLLPGVRAPRSFAVMMVGRLDDYMVECAGARGVSIDQRILELAGVAAVKKAYAMYRAAGIRSVILVGAIRGFRHVAPFIGGDLILTIPPAVQARLIEDDPPFSRAIDDPVDAEALRELESKLPEFRKAYEEDGMGVEEFERYGANVKTQNQFIEHHLELVRWVGMSRDDRGA